MAMPGVRLAHLGAGCNRVVNALDWGAAGLLAYAAHNAVLIYDPEEARVLGALLGHTDRVACVHWLPAAPLGLPPGTAALASGGGDGTVRLWLWSPATPGQPWRLCATLQSHATPVTSLATLPAPGGSGLLLVSTAGDGEVLVWEGNGGGGGGGEPAALQQAAWRLRQRIPLGHVLQDCAALARLPADPAWLLLALGGVDGGVRLYLAPPGGDFALACCLAGHQDWVKSLAWAQLDDGKLLLASASQDRNVRIWAVQQQQQQRGAAGAVASGGAAPAAAAGAAGAALLTRYAPKPLLRTDRHDYSATLEALLIGHEDWVHSVAWHPAQPAPGGGGSAALTQPPCLLSASMDRTMMVWRPDASTGLWMSEESVGDAGSNHLGYYSCCWAPDGSGIAAHGFTGALHIWRRPRGGGGGGAARRGGGWLPAHALGGHYGPVVDACWAADGACLLTVSEDQTARMTTRLAGGHWCEVARPQVHGHDFSSVAALPCPPTSAGGGGAGNGGSPAAAPRYVYASGSEEKVVRVFEAPRAFHDTLALAHGRAPAGGGGGGRAGALGAALPALGLSNKAVYEEDAASGGAEAASLGVGALGLGPSGPDYPQGPDLAPRSAPSAVAGPPLEEHLAQNTLWPEVHKLYGHGNELYCLAADPRGSYLASACRAQSADAAAIWLWDTSKWVGAAQLHAHTLTVTQLAFSPDGRFLASASRDRTVAVFERQEGGAAGGAAAAGGDAGPPFRLVGRIKAHARIVWGLHWSPDSALLATASRDGKVKVWRMAGPGADEATLPSAAAVAIDCGDSVRSVQFAPCCQPGAGYHLATGLEGGGLQLLRLAGDGGGELAAQRVWEAPLHERHAAAVRRLCWRREEGGGGGGERLQLASCSEDHSIRIFSVCL